MIYTENTKRAMKLCFEAHYVTAIKSNPIASAVKHADLEHNSDLSRLDVIDEKALKRKEKYATAIALLKA